MTLLGILVGMSVLFGLLVLAGPLIADRFGLVIGSGPVTGTEGLLLAMVLAAGVLVGLIAGYRAYRLSLADGLAIRI